MPKTRGNGQGSVQHIGVNNWKCTITVGYKKGKQIRISKQGFWTKNEALAWAYEQKEKANPLRCSVASLWNSFLIGGYQDLSKSQKQKLDLAYKRIKSIHKKNVDTLRLKDLQQLVNEQEHYYQKREIKIVLSHIYKIAIIDGYVNNNLASYIKLPKLEEKPRQAFTLEEIAEFWKLYNEEQGFVSYILLMIYTGMMPQELFNCTTNMVDLEDGIIIGCGAKTEKRKTTPIRLADDIKPVLEYILNRRDVRESHRLFPHDRTTFYDWYGKVLESLPSVRRLPAYCCRHTTATLLSNLGVDANIIREVMRHSNFQTTTRYIHFSNEPITYALNRIKIDSN